jgi:biofilm protein TabA
MHKQQNEYYMKNFLTIMAITTLFGLFGCKDQNDPAKWNDKQVDKWYDKGEWLNDWQVKPDESINRRVFAISYFQQKERWDKAFQFLKNSDLSGMELKRFDIDGDNVYAPISEYYSKKEEDARYESHQKYIDIQYVISGKELIGITKIDDLDEILQTYDSTKDIMFMTVKKIENHKADPGRFFIFFPSDVHRPGLRDGDSTLVRKAVVKVKID